MALKAHPWLSLTTESCAGKTKQWNFNPFSVVPTAVTSTGIKRGGSIKRGNLTAEETALPFLGHGPHVGRQKQPLNPICPHPMSFPLLQTAMWAEVSGEDGCRCSQAGVKCHSAASWENPLQCLHLSEENSSLGFYASVKAHSSPFLIKATTRP